MQGRSYSYDESYLQHGTGKEWEMAPRGGVVTSSAPGTPDRTQLLHTSSPSALPLHHRTNFGKNMGYLPPPTGYWGGSAFVGTADLRDYGNNGDTDSVPFDQRDEMKESTGTRLEPPPQLSTQTRLGGKERSGPFDESVDETGSSFTAVWHSATPIGRVRSDKSRPFDEQTQVLDGWNEVHDTGTDDWKPFGSDLCAKNDEHDRGYYSSNDADTYGSYRMAPPRISGPTRTPFVSGDRDDISRADLSTRVHLSTPDRKEGSYVELGGTATDSSVSGLKVGATNGKENHSTEDGEGDDDDSIFDFDGEGRRKKGRGKRVSKGRRRLPIEDEDDTSLENAYGALSAPPTSLQQRAHAAWKRKSAVRASSPRSGAGRPSSMRQSSPSPKKTARVSESDSAPDYNQEDQAPAVSFGKSDRVQYFEAETDETTVADTTFGGRSMNSYYTKSAESEVEDIIKDILLIGSGHASNPGRRKIKYRPDVKLKMREEVVVEDDDTLETSLAEDEQKPKEVEPTVVKAPLPTVVPVSTDDKVEDPLLGIWNFVEGSLGAVFGYDGEKESPEANVSPATEQNVSAEKAQRASSSDGGGFNDILNFASDVLLGSPSSEMAKTNQKERQPPDSARGVDKGVGQPPAVKTAPSLDEDGRLFTLALQAARSFHKIHGREFDESYDLDIVSDIKFSVVDVAMPLGLVFQENDTGCWITKVLSDGNARKTGNVRIGDQLAAIDGTSAIHMKVDEIASMVKSKNGSVELTFLRYVGPMRASAQSVQEEGYEIRAMMKKAESTKKVAFEHDQPTRKTDPKRVEKDSSKGLVTASKPQSSMRGRGRTGHDPPASPKSKAKSSSTQFRSEPTAKVKEPTKKRFGFFRRK